MLCDFFLQLLRELTFRSSNRDQGGKLHSCCQNDLLLVPSQDAHNDLPSLGSVTLLGSPFYCTAVLSSTCLLKPVVRRGK